MSSAEDTEAPKLSSECKPQEEARHAVFGNGRTSKSSNASFLEIVFSSRTRRKSNKVVKKSLPKVWQRVLSSSGFLHGLAGPLMPQHAIPAMLATSWLLFQSHHTNTRSAAETHQTPVPWHFCCSAWRMSCSSGFIQGSWVFRHWICKEGGCHRRGISKRSGPMSGPMVPDFRRHWVYRVVIYGESSTDVHIAWHLPKTGSIDAFVFE